MFICQSLAISEATCILDLDAEAEKNEALKAIYGDGLDDGEGSEEQFTEYAEKLHEELKAMLEEQATKKVSINSHKYPRNLLTELTAQQTSSQGCQRQGI